MRQPDESVHETLPQGSVQSEEEEERPFSPSGFWDKFQEDDAEASTPVNEEVLARDLAAMAESVSCGN